MQEQADERFTPEAERKKAHGTNGDTDDQLKPKYVADAVHIPLPGTSCTAELDIFSGHYKGLMLVEVEFETEEQANAFVPPEWFGKDVTFSGEYQNSRLASI